MEFFRRLFETDFMPHGHCYFWKPSVLWSNVLGDGLISLSYFVIPFLLVRFLKKRQDVRFRGVFYGFAAFILACGTTHLIDIISVWHPVYRLEGLVKIITALISASTVGLLFYIFPVILRIPTPQEWTRTQKSLDQSQEHLRVMLQNAPIGMALTNMEGKFIEVNDAMCNMFKYDKEKFITLNFRDITHSDYLSVSNDLTSELNNRDREVINMEKKYLRSDGNEFWALVNVVSLREQNANIVQITNIDEQKKKAEKTLALNRQLEVKVQERTRELGDSNKDLENFIYAITHDLRVPMHNLSGLVEVVNEELDEVSGNDVAMTALGMIGQNARKMDNIIVELLAFSRASRKELNKNEIDVKELMEQVYEKVSLRYSDKEIEFKIGELPPAIGDPTAIQLVCQNLISNALKYSSKKDVIRIEVAGTTNDGYNIYSVKDNGIGFDQRYAGKLFTLFQRLHTNEEFEGSGVGMATSHRLIMKHGGEMWAEGKPGEGAIFYFSLPSGSTT